jgi:hypothetical protein
MRPRAPTGSTPDGGAGDADHGAGRHRPADAACGSVGTRAVADAAVGAHPAAAVETAAAGRRHEEHHEERETEDHQEVLHRVLLVHRIHRSPGVIVRAGGSAPGVAEAHAWEAVRGVPARS